MHVDILNLFSFVSETTYLFFYALTFDKYLISQIACLGLWSWDMIFDPGLQFTEGLLVMV